MELDNENSQDFRNSLTCKGKENKTFALNQNPTFLYGRYIVQLDYF